MRSEVALPSGVAVRRLTCVRVRSSAVLGLAVSAASACSAAHGGLVPCAEGEVLECAFRRS
jgi:hypothetical protein